MRPLLLASLLLAVCAASVGPGCSRSRYRRQADAEAYCLVDHAAGRVDARGVSAKDDPFTIAPDPRSRMANPDDGDFPPMPPDDPTSHELMECVDCKRGWPFWRKRYGTTGHVENPDWLSYLPVNERGELVLDLHGAMEVALVNSPFYQSQLEELYLSALDVTFERFRFQTQFFGGSSVFYDAEGRLRTGTGRPSSRLTVNPLDPANRLRAERFFATGGDMVVGLANSLVWEFSGPNEHRVNTLLDFSFVQPLLRGAGRARVLERLTLSERTLLANVRQMEQFRQGFYVQVATGRSAGAGPSRRGGFFGGAGLEGFTGVGGGGFGRVGRNGTAIGAGAGVGAAAAGGYIGLLQAMQEIRNQEANVGALRVSLAQLRAFRDAGRLGVRGEVQVGLAETALFNAESRLLSSRALFQSMLDEFKLQMGLPPHLELVVRDPLLDPFNLIDPDLVEIQGAAERLLDETRTREFGQLEHAEALRLIEEGVELEVGPPPPQVDAAAVVERAEVLLQLIERHLQVVEEDFALLQTNAPARRESLRRLAQRPEVAAGDLDPDVLSVEEFDRRIASLVEDDRLLRQRFACDRETFEILRKAHAAGLDPGLVPVPCREALRARQIDPLMPEVQPKEAPPARDRTPWTTALTELSRNLLELTLVQARIRANSVVLLPINLTSSEALEIARVNRRDWMNARAELVNVWRLIEFNANDLQAGLNLVFSGDIGNVGRNPVKFDGRNGRVRVGVQFDSPLTRIAERNLYRQSLIEYEQARRQYYTLVDRIERGLRDTMRTIQLDELNFELRREAVQVALRRYHFTLLDLTRPIGRPVAPGVVDVAADDLAATTARDMVDSLADLASAQNDFLSVWVNYQVLRVSLDFDMGTMELDERGIWIDPGRDIGAGRGPRHLDEDDHEPVFLPLEPETLPEPQGKQGATGILPVHSSAEDLQLASPEGPPTRQPHADRKLENRAPPYLQAFDQPSTGDTPGAPRAPAPTSPRPTRALADKPPVAPRREPPVAPRREPPVAPRREPPDVAPRREPPVASRRPYIEIETEP